MKNLTLGGILQERKEITEKGLRFIEGNDTEYFLSYNDLYRRALEVLWCLQDAGIEPKNELIFQIEDNETFVVIFWACILGGIIPVPLSVGRNYDHRQKIFNVWKILNDPFIVTTDENVVRLQKHAEANDDIGLFNNISKKTVNVKDIIVSSELGLVCSSDENDIAFIQFSSGSTGSPKGVMLTHKNLITNIKGITEASEYSEQDSKLSWMPLTHDMGLIGFHLCPLYCGINQLLMPTSLFIRRPALWLSKASEHKASILCSPNFGYKYLMKQFDSHNDYGWDLSNVRMIYNGAEPISEEICREFSCAIEKYGLKKTAMYPVYGLAEASLAVSFSRLEEDISSVCVNRMSTKLGSRVKFETESENTVSFVNVGKAIPYCSLKIVDQKHEACSEKVIGHILIHGENVTSGYYNNPDATKKAVIAGKWVDTGDLGFMHEGNLYVTGRAKDIIFVNGQNFYPHDIEQSLETVAGIELGKIVVAGRTNHATGQEEVLVFILHKGKLDKFLETHNEIIKHINRTYAFEPDVVVPVREIPKTTSGKVQRFKLIEEYAAGKFDSLIVEIREKNDKTVGLFVAPSNANEKMLHRIWSDVLLHANFGVCDRFFEVGGNSLKAAQVLALVHKQFGVELDYNNIYEKQTIRELISEIASYELSEYVPIPEIEKSDIYPISSAQRRLYYLWEVDPESTAYNIPVAFSIKGNLETDKLEQAVLKLIRRHEILRSAFCLIDGEPKLKFYDGIDFKLHVSTVQSEFLKQELKQRVRPYNLARAPLFRFELLKFTDETFVLFVDFHHIISDGVSMSLIVDEMLQLYKGSNLPELDIDFKDYILWERSKLYENKYIQQSSFWFEQFADGVPVLKIPTDFTRPSLMGSEGGKLHFSLDASLSVKLREFAKNENTSLFSLFFSVYSILLGKYSGQDDIVIGIPVAGRNHFQLQKLLGMFVNNLPVRTQINTSDTFRNVCHGMEKCLLQAFNNQEFPFGELVDAIGQKRDVSRNAIFDTMFIYQNMDKPRYYGSEITFEQFFFDPGFSKYDLSLEMFDNDDEIKVNFEFSTALFKKETIQRMSSSFQCLLQSIVVSADSRIADLSVIDDNESKKYIAEFNDTKQAFPEEELLHKLFERSATENPERTAVELGMFRDNVAQVEAVSAVTYSELCEKSEKLAILLRNKGVDADVPVAIVLDRSVELVIAIVAVLKAGGCFVPIGKSLPKERVKYILSDCSADIVLTDSFWPDSDSGSKIKEGVHIIDVTKPASYSHSGMLVRPKLSSRNLAYIIYTSGTTGNPKGVMVEHRSMVNYISFAEKAYLRNEKATFPLYTSISFDLTLTSIFVPLLTGNTIRVYPDTEDSFSIDDVIKDNKCDILKATPSHLKILQENRLFKTEKSASTIKKIIVGGEAFSMQLAKSVSDKFENGVEIYNEYGPTEATVGCMICQYDASCENLQSVPIGVPIDNTQIYLLDRHLKPVPIGVEAELYISGDCLARGYLKQPELTEEKFIANPYTEGQRMYKTGDLAKRLPDGTIEFVGRVDQQIKINGYRVEIEEIETLIVKLGLKASAVVPDTDGSLCAYLVHEVQFAGNAEEEKFIADLKKELSGLLPAYMLPKHFMLIEDIPLTKNGKIDYGSLPLPTQKSDTLHGATNDIQRIMLDVWSDVLNKKVIGITDNFFELGGDSIKAVQISSRLYDQNILVKVKDILRYQTVEQIAPGAETADEQQQYEQGIAEGEVALNPIQRWFFDQNFDNLNFYNQSVLLELKRDVDTGILQKAFDLLLRHHDALRMNYNSEKRVMFYNNSYLNCAFELAKYDIKNAQSDDGNGLIEICQELKSSINIENSLLIKAAIICGDCQFLFVTVHHLIIDGLSWRIILDDLYKIYAALSAGNEVVLSQKTASLLDWDQKLNELARNEKFVNQVKFWDQQMPGELQLPSTNIETRIEEAHFTLSPELTTYLLHNAHKAYNTDVEIILLAALVRALNSLSFKNGLNIELEKHGRLVDGIDLSRTVGWFTSLFPVKLNAEYKAFDKCIRQVKEVLKSLPDQGIGYGINKYLRRSLRKADACKLRFNYLGQFGSELNNELFRYIPAGSGSETATQNNSMLHLDINAAVIDGSLRVDCYMSGEFIGICFEGLFEKSIIDILTYLQTEDDVHLTPADFEYVDLDEDDLDALFN